MELQALRPKSRTEQHSPPFSRRGARAIKPLEREGGAVVKEPRSAPFLLKLLTAPSAPAKERDHLLMAQPPRLAKAGNALPFDFMCKAPRCRFPTARDRPSIPSRSFEAWRQLSETCRSGATDRRARAVASQEVLVLRF